MSVPQGTYTVQGSTRSGRILRVEGDDPHALKVWIDREEAHIEGLVAIYRDGGTVVLHTDRGSVTLPRRMGHPDRRPRLDDEVVEYISRKTRFKPFTDRELHILWHAVAHDDGVRYFPQPDTPEGLLLGELEAEMSNRGFGPAVP